MTPAFESLDHDTCVQRVSRALYAPEVAISNEKETAKYEEKEAISTNGLEVVEDDSLPEALDDEGSKEVIIPLPRVRPAFESVERAKIKYRMPAGGRFVYLATTLLSAAVIGLGAGLGVGQSLRRHRTETENSTTSTSSMWDASRIPSPTGTAPPTGIFALALSEPQQTSSACLSQQNQGRAWDCTLPPGQQLGIAVGPDPPFSDSQGASIFYTGNATQLSYEAQAANMNTTFADFLTVLDITNPGAGPAYSFQQTYDKIVVVPESTFSSSGTSRNRRHRRKQEERDTGVVAPGDKPWLCIWNSTFIEGLIYVQQPAVSPGASATATFLPTSTASASRPAYVQQETTLPTFPMMVKLEERNSKFSGQPYCQQYQVLDNGNASAILNDNGDPMIVQLDMAQANDTFCQCQWLSGES